MSGDIVVTASGKYPGVVGTTDTIKVRVLKQKINLKTNSDFIIFDTIDTRQGGEFLEFY